MSNFLDPTLEQVPPPRNPAIFSPRSPDSPRSLDIHGSIRAPALFLVIMQTRNQSCQWGRTEFFRGSSRGRGEAGILIRYRGFGEADRATSRPSSASGGNAGDAGVCTPLPSWWPSPGGPADPVGSRLLGAILQALKRPIVPIDPVSMGSVSEPGSWRIGGQHVECASGLKPTWRCLGLKADDGHPWIRQAALDPLVPMAGPFANTDEVTRSLGGSMGWGPSSMGGRGSQYPRGPSRPVGPRRTDTEVPRSCGRLGTDAA